MSETASRLHELLDRLAAQCDSRDPKVAAYVAGLRDEIDRAGKTEAETQELVRQYEEAYAKLTAPANRVGVFLRILDEDRLLVLLGDQEYVCTCDPAVDVPALTLGARVKLNEAYAIIGLMPEAEGGTLVKVGQVMPDGRLRIGSDSPGGQSRLILRAANLAETPIQSGDEVRLDGSGRLAIEHFPGQETQDYFIEEIAETPWSAVGGQEEAISLIKETIENPLLYPDLYRAYDKNPVKGILLYGPPGCGKTLMGKAIAWNLAREYSERHGVEARECFMHISGPKILNMWLGETERMVREIFATARRKASEGRLVVIFIDEAESVLRTRSGGRYLNISNTVVPQFCAEMDGLVQLENVVLVLTSNRPDYIDPAILRPERIDRKVKVQRPNRDAARDILGIYLHDRLPLDPAEIAAHDGPACARKALVEGALAALWKETGRTEFLRIQTRSGETKSLYWRDLVSGALLKSVVDRAKDAAIRRAIAEPNAPHGINLADLEQALADEYRENEIFPKSDQVEDWLKLLDFEPESVVSVKPVGRDKGAEFVRRSVI